MELRTIDTSTMAIVMAHRNTKGDLDLKLLKRVIARILDQSDDNWKLIVVDDHSSYEPALHYLDHLQQCYKNKIIFKKLEEQVGPGIARNHGVQIATRHGCPVVMYCDSDDLIHRDRVKATRAVFLSTQAPTVMYSGFVAVDSEGIPLNEHEITPSLLEILQALANDPPTGMDVWKQIGTRTGYVNLTSTTSVSTTTALLNPFPSESVSEDSHTWMRYSASGAQYIYDASVPVNYRTCREGGSASRERDGSQFYYNKARVDIDGFQQAIILSEGRGTTNRDSESKTLLAAFYVRLAWTMLNENVSQLATELLDQALTTDIITTTAEVQNYPGLAELFAELPGWAAAA